MREGGREGRGARQTGGGERKHRGRGPEERNPGGGGARRDANEVSEYL